MESTLNAKAFGFLPENNAQDNLRALNEAIQNGGEIHIDVKGTYEISGTIKLKSNTTLIFYDDVYIKRIFLEDKPEITFTNEGAFTHNYDKNIKIFGLKIFAEGKIPSFCSYISFSYIKNFTIDGFWASNGNMNYGINICKFSDLSIENSSFSNVITGINLAQGNHFIIKNCVFANVGTPVVLDASDYIDGVTDGEISDCIDEGFDSILSEFCLGTLGSQIKNIVFSGIKLNRRRKIGFSLRLNEGNTSVLPLPTACNLTFKNIEINKRVPIILNAFTPVNSVKFRDTDLKTSVIVLDKIKSENVDYGEAKFSFKNTVFQSFISDLIRCKKLRKTKFTIR